MLSDERHGRISTTLPVVRFYSTTNPFGIPAALSSGCKKKEDISITIAFVLVEYIIKRTSSVLTCRKRFATLSLLLSESGYDSHGCDRFFVRMF